MNTTDAKRVLETALICSGQAMPLRDMELLFDAAVGADTLKRLLGELQDEWAGRGVELIQVASGWRFQSRPEMRPYLDRLHPEKPPKYSRATLETLAIIAYRQPVTRGDMEDIRGVTINSLLLKQLEDRGWIEVIGHRETVGRPALYATTRQFLDDLGLASLDQLPTLEAGDIAGSALDQIEFALSAPHPQALALDEALPVDAPQTAPDEGADLADAQPQEPAAAQQPDHGPPPATDPEAQP
jgi:segregation and condensation protein B